MNVLSSNFLIYSVVVYSVSMYTMSLYPQLTVPAGDAAQADQSLGAKPTLKHTMSSLVSQRKKTSTPHFQQPLGDLLGPKQGSVPGVHVDDQSPSLPRMTAAALAADVHVDDQSSSSPRLTAAALAAAEAEQRSSAERLPVSHRLPVSRSVFASDEGKEQQNCVLA